MRSMGWFSLFALCSSVQICASTRSSEARSSEESRGLQAQVDALEAMVGTHQSLITNLGHRLSRLHQTAGEFAPLTDVMGLDSSGDLLIHGVNVRIVDDEAESETMNGKGNLLMGYDAGGEGSIITGSHNIILGPEHIVGGSEGLVTGSGNTTLGSHAVVLGATDGIASEGAIIIGGIASSALADGSVVVGGERGAATAPRAVVVGGIQNTGSGVDSAVIGGARNEARGDGSVIVGGTGHLSTEFYETGD